MFGASKNTLKSLIRRKKIVVTMPPKLMTSLNGRLPLLAKQIMENNPRISYRAIPGALMDIVGSHVDVPSYKAIVWVLWWLLKEL